jgi:outer membrane protein
MSTKTFAAIAQTAALCAAPALAQDAWYSPKTDGDWLVRVRGLSVMPNETLKMDGDRTASGTISSSVVPELDITYFFTPNIAAELILAVTPHDVRGAGSLSGADIGSVWLLPPTLTAQYHITQLAEWTGERALSKVKPYFGVGVNHTMFFNEDAGQFDSISYDNAFGIALQAGIDIEITDGIYLNADVKYIMMESDWSINNGAVTGSAEINPLIIGLGVGYRF